MRLYHDSAYTHIEQRMKKIIIQYIKNYCSRCIASNPFVVSNFKFECRKHMFQHVRMRFKSLLYTSFIPCAFYVLCIEKSEPYEFIHRQCIYKRIFT